MRALLQGLVLTILVAGSAIGAAPIRDTLIVAGERAGPIALGMNPAELATAMGPPAEMHEGTTTIYSWGDIAAEISASSPGVDVITVNDMRYETSGHIRVGLAAPAVTAVLGQPGKSTSTQGLQMLDYDGLTVVMRNNLVAQIRVRK